MAPYNPHKYPCMASCTPLNFEALQWITLRNRVGNLSALNLNSASIKGTFSLLFGGRLFFLALSLFFKVWIISRGCRRGRNLVHREEHFLPSRHLSPEGSTSSGLEEAPFGGCWTNGGQS